MRARQTLYEDLSTLITNFGIAESQFHASIKVISDSLQQCQDTQRKHLFNYLNLPLEHPRLILDRFGRNLLRHDLSRNEKIWWHFRASLL